MPRTEPQLSSEAIKCGHCSNVGRMKILSTYNDGKTYAEEIPFDGRIQVATYDAGTLWEFYLCEACAKPTVRYHIYDDRYQEEMAGPIICYPEAKQKLEGLPEAIAKAHEAALRVRNVDGNAYAVLQRRLLEIVCLDQEAEGKTLSERLKNLAERGILPPQLAEVADSIRSLGNVGAHASTGDIEERDIHLLDSLSAAVLEYVYIAPQLVARVRQRVAAAKAIEQKRSGSTEE
jgi:hypothetical protein